MKDSRGNNGRMARRNKHVSSGPYEAPKSLDEGDLEAIVRSKPDPFILILDCVQDPHNLGAILRTADGAGVDAVVAPKDKAAALTETVMRISVGAAEFVPFVQVTNLARAMKTLKDMGVWIFGTSDRGDRDIFESDLTGPVAIVMGSEGEGMRRLTEEHCDFLVRIPMKGRVPCLNVSVATGVFLFEALRQRSAPRS